MTWGTGGKGSTKGAGKGQWVFQPYTEQQQSKGGKSGGKGNKSQGQANPNNQSHQNTKQDKKLNQVQQQLAAAQSKIKHMEAQTAGVLSRGDQVLQGQPSTPVICATCGTEHTNPNKVRCRNRMCRAFLNPSEPRAPRLVTFAPKHPLLSNHIQALLEEAGAVECLESKIAPKETLETLVVESDEEMDGGEEDIEDSRMNAEKLLQQLKTWNADPTVIKAQEKLVEGMPKPRKVKATQPILDTASLLRALSNVKEYHDKLTIKLQDDIANCEKVISDAQATLTKVKKEQSDHQDKAVKEICEIQALIQKKQQQNQDVLPPRAPAPAEDQPDQHLMMQATQEWLVKQACPDHIKFFLMNHWNSGPEVAAHPPQPNAEPPRGGKPMEPAEAAWEAA